MSQAKGKAKGKRPRRRGDSSDDLEPQGASHAQRIKVVRPHIAQEYREKHRGDLSEAIGLTRGLTMRAAAIALGMPIQQLKGETVNSSFLTHGTMRRTIPVGPAKS